MREKQIETAILQFIRYSGGWATKVHSGSMRQAYQRKDGSNQIYKMKLARAGTPDIIACLKNRFIAIEVKKDQAEIEKWKRTKETDRRSIVQHAQQEEIRDAGGITIVACSVDEVEADLKELGLLT